MGYGDSPYGTGPWGGALSVTTISVSAAWAITTHSVRVVLTSEPLHSDPFASGDAENPLTWTIVDLTTGRALTVVVASMHDDTSVDLTTIEPLGDHLETHVVTAVGLFSVDGFLVTSPADAQFLGVVQTIDPSDSRADFRDRDLANPPFQIARSTGYAGTLLIGDDGDFDTDSGEQLIRKLVLRRMGTLRGAFRHLPDYGFGLREKEPITGSGDLVSLLRDAEEQIGQEPDVARAVAQGSLDRSGTLILRLSVAPTRGGTINLRMGVRSGRLLEA